MKDCEIQDIVPKAPNGEKLNFVPKTFSLSWELIPQRESRKRILGWLFGAEGVFIWDDRVCL
jgi:hypothetical protein